MKVAGYKKDGPKNTAAEWVKSGGKCVDKRAMLGARWLAAWTAVAVMPRAWRTVWMLGRKILRMRHGVGCVCKYLIINASCVCDAGLMQLAWWWERAAAVVGSACVPGTILEGRGRGGCRISPGRPNCMGQVDREVFRKGVDASLRLIKKIRRPSVTLDPTGLRPWAAEPFSFRRRRGAPSRAWRAFTRVAPSREGGMMVETIIARILEFSGPMPDAEAFRHYLEGLDLEDLQGRLTLLESQHGRPGAAATGLMGG